MTTKKNLSKKNFIETKRKLKETNPKENILTKKLDNPKAFRVNTLPTGNLTGRPKILRKKI